MPPEFLESIYKIDTGSDHVAKFRGDRSRELGDYALKKRKHHEHFISPPVTPYGRPKKSKNQSVGDKIMAEEEQKNDNKNKVSSDR